MPLIAREPPKCPICGWTLGRCDNCRQPLCGRCSRGHGWDCIGDQPDDGFSEHDIDPDIGDR